MWDERLALFFTVVRSFLQTTVCTLISDGSFAPFWLCLDVRFASNNDRMADIRKRSKRAKSRQSAPQQNGRYSITS
jgi:hypothetical protein